MSIPLSFFLPSTKINHSKIMTNQKVEFILKDTFSTKVVGNSSLVVNSNLNPAAPIPIWNTRPKTPPES
jgi:hypothetical protein